MGNLQEFGPSPSRLTFAAVRGGTADVGEGWAGFWSGVDTVLKAPAEHFAALAEARAAAGRDRPAVAIALETAMRTIAGSTPAPDYVEHLRSARRVVSWTFFDAVGSRGRVAPGDSVDIELSLRTVGGRGESGLGWALLEPGMAGPVWCANGGEQETFATGACRFPVTLSGDQIPTTPYYLARARVGDLYSWSGVDARERGLPRGREEFIGMRWWDPRDSAGAWTRVGSIAPVTDKVRDQAFGELRRPVVIVPRVSVKLNPGVAVIRGSASGEARVVSAEVVLESGMRTSVRGNVTIEVPNGWPKPAPVAFALNGLGASAHLTIRVTVPAGVAEGQYPIRAVATEGTGQRNETGAFTVDYPHIRPRQYTRSANARIEVVELTPPLARRVAYVRGAADRVPEALAGAGLNVTILDSTALGTADLSGYDAIVIGPRAYEVDSALIRNNDRLLDYAKNGGRLVVQYQQAVYLEGSFAPFRLGGNSRITDENAPVTMLGATPTQSALAPVFRTPNAIGPEDWQGWVQERALYCPTTWGPELNSLLSMKDPGEAATSGCLLEGKVGRGSYVYTGISFFRELPAGVPGAYRLFFNLLGGSVTP